MDAKAILVIVGNMLIVFGLFFLCGLGRISWDQVLLALGLLAFPSAASALTPKPPPPQRPVTTLLNSKEVQ